MKKIFILLLILGLGNQLAMAAEVSVDSLRKTIQDYIIENHPELKDAEINITFKSIDELQQALKDLKGQVDLKIISPAADLVGKATIPVKIFEDSQFTKKIYVQAQIDIFDRVVVAADKVKKGQILRAEDLMLVKTNISNFTRGFVNNVQTLVGKEVGTNLSKGAALLSWMIREVPEIKRGEKIVIEARCGKIMVSSPGVALEDGYKGREIKIRNLKSKKDLTGKVLTKNSVEVGVF